MALIIEDGTGVANANSYITAADASAFLQLRGNTAWASVPDQPSQEALLISAMDYLNAMYTWDGYPAVTGQPLAWPRVFWRSPVRPPDDWWSNLDVSEAYYVNLGVPAVVRTAQVLLAAEAASGPLAPSSSTGTVTSLRERLEGVGETETKYENAPPSGRHFPLVDGLLKPYILGGPNAGIQSGRRLVG